jgi:hypothetical protein
LAKDAELENPDQVYAEHSKEDKEDSEAIEVVGPTNRKRR